MYDGKQLIALPAPVNEIEIYYFIGVCAIPHHHLAIVVAVPT